MKVELISYSNLNEKVCGIASKTCVSDHIPDKEEDVMKSLKGAIDSGHESVLEHWSATFAIEGISRACSHQLVRHRMASYSQQSQRYVNQRRFGFVMPKSIEESDDQIWSLYSRDLRDVANAYEEGMKIIANLYQSMLNVGIPEEDARYILPNACCANLVMTMNGRELLHFFNLRCCTRAQWEIRELADKMLELVKDVAPIMFENAGASCMATGKCPEGKKSCGRVKE